MTEEYGKSTRKNRFEKKRTNTKAIAWLSVIGGILIIIIIALMIFGGDDEPASQESDDTGDKIEINEVDSGDKDTENSSTEEEDSTNELEVVEKEEKEEENSENDKEEESDPAEVESDDPNVKRAFKDNWQPVATSQSEPHKTDYDKESVDWKEMSQAIEQALGISPDNQIAWCRERAGDNKVKATVSPNSNQDETYRVQLEWVENKGWKPVLVEELIKNDKKKSC